MDYISGSLAVVKESLPDTPRALNDFIVVNRQKLQAIQAAIKAATQVGVVGEAKERLVAQGQELAEAVTDAECKMGELLREIPKAPSNQYTAFLPTGQKAKTGVTAEMGLTTKQVSQYQRMAEHREIVEQAKEAAREEGRIVSRNDIVKRIQADKKEKEIQAAKEKIAEQTKAEQNVPVIQIGDSVGMVLKDKADLLLTDPPYSTDVDDIDGFAAGWLAPALMNVKDTGFAYVFIGAYPDELRAYLNAEIPEHMKLEQVLIWTYKNTLGNNPKDRYKQNYQACLFFRGVNAPPLDCPMTNEQWAVQEINAPDGRQGDRYHAWQKPMEIAERFIRHSTKQGMTVYDPFACTGTFVIAAAKLGRIGYGVEISEDNAAIAEQRGCTIER